MPFQAILLSLIILISLILSGGYAIKPESSESESSFSKELTLKLGAKAEQLSLYLRKEKQSALEEAELLRNQSSEALANTRQNVNQTFAEIALFHELVINKLAEASLEKNKAISESVPPEASAGAGISLSLPQPKMSDYCSPIDASSLTGRASLVKYLYYNLTVFESNPEKRWPMASITKLMTSVIIAEKMDPETEVTMTEEAVGEEGTAGDFKVGEVFKVEDLIKAILIGSSNDAAKAMAQTYGEKEFVDEMQKKANDLKMLQTTYVEPTGLSFVNQSTISDLTKLSLYIYKNHPELLEISRQRETEILELKSGKSRKVLNVDAFAGEPDFLGGKTGYTEEAGRNLVAIFKVQDQVILTIVLGAENAFDETREIKKFIRYCEPPKYWYWRYGASE